MHYDSPHAANRTLYRKGILEGSLIFLNKETKRYELWIEVDFDRNIGADTLMFLGKKYEYFRDLGEE